MTSQGLIAEATQRAAAARSIGGFSRAHCGLAKGVARRDHRPPGGAVGSDRGRARATPGWCDDDLIPAAGRHEEVRGLAPGIEQITISIPCGEQVVPLPRASRYLGFIFAHANTPAEVERSLRQAHGLLDFRIA
jgi:hypothetical protein